MCSRDWCPGTCGSFYTYGAVVYGCPEEVLAKAQASMEVQVAIKAIPEDPIKAFSRDFPQFQWTLPAEVSAKDIVELGLRCKLLLEEGPAACRAANYAFAKYVALNLEGSVNVPSSEDSRRTHFELCGSNMLWRSRHSQDLPLVIMNALARLMDPPIHFWKQSTQDLPPPLENIGFAASLADTVLAILAQAMPMESLDGDATRGKLAFKCGSVWDFKAKQLRKLTPQDRRSMTTGCDFAPWQPPLPGCSEELFAEVAAWCRLGQPNLKDNAHGLKALECLKALEPHCELLKVLVRFAGSWEPVLWLLRQFCRSLRSTQRSCKQLTFMQALGTFGSHLALLADTWHFWRALGAFGGHFTLSAGTWRCGDLCT